MTTDDFGKPGFPGFGLGGVVHLFDPDQQEIDRAGPEPRPVVGISNACLPSAPCRQSVAGVNGAYMAIGFDPGDIGSPGIIPEPSVLPLLTITGLLLARRRAR